MKRKSYVFILVVIVLALLSSMVIAGDAPPASKAAVQVKNYNILEYTNDQDWTPILSTTLKTAQQKDLLIDVSLECGLYTFTKVKSKDMTADTTNAMASIMVRVVVDGHQVYPDDVHFAKRTQELTAILQGQLELVASAGGIYVLNTVAPEEISLLLETLSANSFNFVCMNLDSGVHTIEVEAKISSGGLAQMGTFEAKAMIGRGSVIVEEVRMIQADEDMVIESAPAD